MNSFRCSCCYFTTTVVWTCMTVVLLLSSFQIHTIIVVDAFSSRVAPVVSSGYFPTPAFRIMNTGEGTVQIKTTTAATTTTTNTDIDATCQFAQFGPRLSFEGIIEWAEPPTAHIPLQNDPTSTSNSDSDTAETSSQGRGRILVVKRGLCSFETKMNRAKQVPGVIGVILVNDDDSTFVAVSDTTTATPTIEVQEELKTSIDIGKPSSSAEVKEVEEDIPFVVVSSVTGLELLQNNIGSSVSVTALEADQSKCYGGWDAYDHNDERRSSFVLPLFPVSKEPLLPGGTLQMQIGQREYEELEYYLQQQQQQGKNEDDDDSISSAGATVVYVAVAYCLDPNINILAETATLAMIDYSAAVSQKSTASSREDVFAPRPLRMISVKGIEPCHLRTLIRDSTRAGLGLGLIERCDNNNDDDVVSDNASAAKEVAEKIRTAITIDDDDTDMDQFSSNICRTLFDLPPRQQQAVLACSTLERLQGIHQLLTRIQINNNNQEESKSSSNSSSNSSSSYSNQNFVATAVKKVLPSIVSVEVSSSAGSSTSKGKSTTNSDDKAAGFFIGPDGIIVTNRHVIAKVTDHASSSSVPPPTIVVTTQNKVSYPATVISVSENYDIAFLKIIKTDTDTDDVSSSSSSEEEDDQHRLSQQLFPVASLGNGNNVQLGDWMIAIGSPAEFDIVVSLGIASTIQRPTSTTKKTTTTTTTNTNKNIVPLLDTSPTFLGTDALFNKGISGGPLINDVGDVVGMCTYLREDLNGLGFAISINRLVDAFDALQCNMLF